MSIFSFRSLTIASAACVGLAFATAQPAVAQDKGVAPVDSKAPGAQKPEFHSALHDGGPGPGEAAAFNNLVQLHDAWQAAIDALAQARACGTARDIAAAEAARDHAEEAYDEAVDQYVRDYSNNLYPPPPAKLKGQAADQFKLETSSVLGAVNAASTYKHKPVAACLPPPTTPVNVGPKPPTPDQPSPPLPERTGLLGPSTAWMDFSNFHGDFGGSGFTENTYTLGGTIRLNCPEELLDGLFGPDIDIGANYHHSTVGDFNSDVFEAIVEPVFHFAGGRFAPVFNFRTMSGASNVQTYNYGAYAEVWAGDRLTIDAKAGGISSQPGSSGYYVGGGAMYYPAPYASLDGHIDFTRFASGGSQRTDYSVKAEVLAPEFLTPEAVHISGFIGYVRSQFNFSGFSAGSSADIFNVGIKVYLNNPGPSTLADLQRSSPIENSTVTPK